MVKKSIFLHLKKRLKLFCIINVFFMIPFSSFGANSISWNSEEDLFSVQYENATVKDILDNNFHNIISSFLHIIYFYILC